jgi:hypothetical protein
MFSFKIVTELVIGYYSRKQPFIFNTKIYVYPGCVMMELCFPSTTYYSQLIFITFVSLS